MVYQLLFYFSVDVGDFIIGLSQTSSFFSLHPFPIIVRDIWFEQLWQVISCIQTCVIVTWLWYFSCFWYSLVCFLGFFYVLRIVQPSLVVNQDHIMLTSFQVMHYKVMACICLPQLSGSMPWWTMKHWHGFGPTGRVWISPGSTNIHRTSSTDQQISFALVLFPRNILWRNAILLEMPYVRLT